MKEIIEDKIKKTKIDYDVLGLYSYEQYESRLITLREILSLCD